MSTLNYLAYGSNLFPPRLAARIHIVAENGSVALPDYELSFTKRGRDGSAKCTLLPRLDTQAWVAVYTIKQTDKSALDIIEGVGHGYAVQWLDSPLYGRCFLYLATADALVDNMRPFDWYKAYVLAGAHYHSLPPRYIAAIESTPSIADPDIDRSTMNFARLG